MPSCSERRAGQRDRPLLLDRGRVVIADRGALGHRAGPADRAGRGEQRLDQRGLPGAGVADQHHVAYPAGVVHHRRGAGDPLLLVLLRHGCASRLTRFDAVSDPHIHAASAIPHPNGGRAQPRRAKPPTRRPAPYRGGPGRADKVGRAMAKIFSVSARAGVADVVDPVGPGPAARRRHARTRSPSPAPSAWSSAPSASAARGHLVVGALIVTFCALTDVLDGAMARDAAGHGRAGSARCSTRPWTGSPTARSSARVAYWLADDRASRARPWSPRCSAWSPARSSRTSRPAPRGSA